ncbi:hypothetical protein [Halalkalibacter urbisdiaboli]|uniref:hypothetical protein n=1 Tax=Halalkalibacter urbisdiaboli TaxID=1960589 RepID=UPI000B4415A2|nr:hypothetical protein [Halalkalibacter urbisdiaboli]
MKKIVIISLLAIITTSWIIFSDFEFGKYDSFEEVVEKGIPYKVKDVLHTENIDGITVVMYTTEPNQDAFPSMNTEALTVAFLEGNDNEGWENIGPNGWSHYDNNNMTVNYENVRKYDNKGNLLKYIPVTFGEIKNASIRRVETKEKNSENFNEVAIIEHNHKRYYFDIGFHKIVRGLSEEGEVIDRQGG